MSDMSDTHKTIVACVACVCLMMTVTITSANLTRPPKTAAERFIAACSWGGGQGATVHCAEIWSRHEGGQP